MRTKLWNRVVTLMFLLALTSTSAWAEDWKNIAQEQGVNLTYEAVGNLARLRFTNTNSTPMTVNWTTSVQLVSGKRIENKSELNLDAGETIVIAGGPYRDAGNPVEIKNVTGTLRTKKTVP